jgi:predicted acyltransferase
MQQRFYSLDVFRGATVALMILVNNPGSWSHIYGPLAHADWHGCTPTDLVFPFFLFAVGNALAFVLPTMETRSTGYFLAKVSKRALLIFAIGLFLNWSPFVKWDNDQLVAKAWSQVRILGVLQRIAIAYLLAALLVYFSRPRGGFVVAAILLLGYWSMCLLLGNPADPYSQAGWFGTAWDLELLGKSHMYKMNGVPFDPEGLASTLPAIAQVILGYLTGQFIREKGKSYEMLARLLVIGCIMMAIGYSWDMVLPVNKKIWTSSYVMYTTGLAILLLGIMMYTLDWSEERPSWSRFFNVFGKNPLFIFVLSGFLPRVLALFRWTDHVGPNGKPVYTSTLPWLYQHIFKPIAEDQRVGSMLYALFMIVMYWLIVYLLDKKKIYIRV